MKGSRPESSATGESRDAAHCLDRSCAERGVRSTRPYRGSATAGLTINLTGTVSAGDVYVLAQSAASAAILAQADQTNGAGGFNGDDAVVLRKGTAMIDSIGQTGFDPGTEWGTGLTSTADNTLPSGSP